MNRCNVAALILLISVLNVVDGLMTLGWVLLTEATEFNPFMKPLIACSPFVFIVTKTVVVSLGLLVLWLYRRRPLSKIGLLIILAFYTCVVIYHGWAIVHFVL